MSIRIGHCQPFKNLKYQKRYSASVRASKKRGLGYSPRDPHAVNHRIGARCARAASKPLPFRPIGALRKKYGASRDLNLPGMVHKGVLARGRPLRNGSRKIGCVPATDQPLKQLGSKRLQLNKGGGATPFLLRDLEDGDVNSIPTAPTNLTQRKGLPPRRSAKRVQVSN